jgi:hypothetical protein
LELRLNRIQTLQQAETINESKSRQEMIVKKERKNAKLSKQAILCEFLR